MTLGQIPGSTDSDFTAHALLAATRADLVEHLVIDCHMTERRIRARLATFVGRIVNHP